MFKTSKSVSFKEYIINITNYKRIIIYNKNWKIKLRLTYLDKQTNLLSGDPYKHDTNHILN